MTQGLKPYPEYKDSGVPWLGRVPAHWTVLRLKRLLRIVDQRSTTGEETLLSLRRDHGIVVYAEHFSRPAQGETTVGYKRVRPGQIVVNRLQANNGLIFDSKYDGLVSPDYSVFAPTATVDARLLSQVLRTPEYKTHFRRESTGLGTGSAGFLRLYDDRFLDTVVPVPPREEQSLIVRFLAALDVRVRRLIRAKQKLIALLDEQKQAVTDALVIRRTADAGCQDTVQPNPHDCDHVRLKYVATVQTGITLGKRYDSRTEPRSYLRVANVQFGRLDLREVKTLDVPPEEAARSTLRVGDVLLTEGGDIDKLGRACIWRGEVPRCLHQNHIFAVRCSPRLNPEFLVSVLASGHGRDYFQVSAKQTTNLAATNSTTLKAFPIALPTISRQREIVEVISANTAALGRALQMSSEQIALARELQARLVADVVTGKFDVRDAAARLSDGAEIAELQLTDEAIAEDSTEETDAAAEEVEA